VLELREVTKRFGRSPQAALKGFSLRLAPGEILGLVGVNGAGKTTAIRIATGAALPTSGTVVVDAHDLSLEKPKASALIGWVPESPVHPPGARLRTLVDYYSDMAKVRPQERKPELLANWGLHDYETSRFRTLSMGLKKRFALAVSEIQSPRYYLLDEIFNGLDPAGAATARAWVIERRSDGCGILVSSHQLHAVQELSDRVAIIHRGRLLEVVETKSIPSSGAQTLRITLDRIDDPVLAILGRFGTVRPERNSVIITADKIDALALGQAVVQAGYALKGIDWTERNLEAYFIERIGKAE
jgi:ABC-2 type transport system ATP-binding protein